MKKSFAFGSSVLCVLAAGLHPVVAEPTRQQAGAALIIPGQSIGEIRLGAELSEVEKKLGRPAVGEGAMGRAWEAWFAPKAGGGRGDELDVRAHATETSHDKAVEAIRIESPFFHTRESISTQSSLAEVWQAFPELRYSAGREKDKAVEIYEDDTRGIAIEVRRTFTSTGSVPPPGTAWGVCQAIIVFRDGTGEKTLPAIPSLRDMPADNR